MQSAFNRNMMENLYARRKGIDGVPMNGDGQLNEFSVAWNILFSFRKLLDEVH